jgi:hypothetical protein
MLEFIEAIDHLMNDLEPEAIGRIADYVGEHGADDCVDRDLSDVRKDTVVLACLRIVVDEVNRRG